MAEKGRVALNATSDSTFPSTLNKQIKAINHRGYNKDSHDSHYNKVDDTLSNIVTSTGENAETVLNNINNGLSPLFYLSFDITESVQGDLTISNLTSNNSSVSVSNGTVSFSDVNSIYGLSAGYLTFKSGFYAVSDFTLSNTSIEFSNIDNDNVSRSVYLYVFPEPSNYAITL